MHITAHWLTSCGIDLVIGQPFNSCDVASLCLLCESIELHVFNEFVSDFRAHELPPW
jgi:hypothetical protein